MRVCRDYGAGLVQQAAFAGEVASPLVGVQSNALVGGLLVGGSFAQAGDVTANNIAHWDGSAWSTFTGPSGTGTNDLVTALVVYNGELVAGGGS